ncbi:hypothetical protein [Laceyella putida]|uniref:DUF87 domain-containing protein n=1 Tax=Laceyella putida TaxID=110101 RepID=A0ABW2RPC7_9BACL
MSTTNVPSTSTRYIGFWNKAFHVFGPTGTQVHPLYTRKIRIAFEQLTKHFLLTGAPGMGKSSLIIDMLDGMKWIKDPNHSGFTIIDTSQETVAVIQNRLAYMEKKGLFLM